MFSKKYFQTLVLAVLLVIGSVHIFAQEGLGTYVLKTGSGFLLVENNEKISFSLEFKGEKIDPIKSDHPNFIIDDKLIQVVTVPVENFWKPNDTPKTKPTSEQLLEAHKTWESDYLGEALKSKLSVTSEFFEVDLKRKVMFWTFPMPKTIETPFSHQMFLTTMLGENVLGINSSPETATSLTTYRAYIVTAMNTLKTSDKPFNIKELSESLAKEKPAL